MSKITKIEQQKNNKNRYSLFIDDQFYMGVYSDVIVALGLKKNMKVDSDEIKKIIDIEHEKKAFYDGIHYISYKMRTEFEVRRKLKNKEYNDRIIDKSVDKLKEHNYINDAYYVKEYIYFKQKKFGKKRIYQELKKKGVDDCIIEQGLSTHYEADEHNLARQLAKKQNNKYGDISIEKRYRRLTSYLSRRGYNYSIVKNVVKEIMQPYYDK